MNKSNGPSNDFDKDSPGRKKKQRGLLVSQNDQKSQNLYLNLQEKSFHQWIIFPVIVILLFIHLYHSSSSDDSLFKNAIFSVGPDETQPDRKINNHNTKFNLHETEYAQVKGEHYIETFKNPDPLGLPTLQISFLIYEPDHLRILIKDADKPRYELPFEEPYPHVKDPQYLPLEESNFEAFIRYDPFDIVIKRRITQEVIFKLTDRFMYMDMYIEFSFYTPTNQIYGFGERIRSHQLNPGTYTLFIFDRSGEFDEGESGFNQQGHHSMYLMREVSGKYHVSFLRNVNAQEVILTPQNKVTWKIIGGVIDLSFFLGDSPEEATQKYHQYIGGWTLPALWHLGYHQTKFWGYRNISHINQILENFEKANLPLDVLSSDLDYMVRAKNFVFDEENFPPHQTNQVFQTHRKRWIPLIDSWIPYDRSYKDFDYDRILSVTMKDQKGNVCVGDCLLGEMYILDFLNPNIEPIWTDLLEELNSQWTLSGFWLDANEITDYRFRSLSHYRDRKYFDLPFYPGKLNFYEQRLVDLDCVHYGGVDEYNVRSLPSLLQSKYTYNYLKRRFPFPYVLSRGTMFGSGQFASTFIADTHSNWESVVPSLGAVLSFSLFGIPMVGVDICGFVGDDKVAEDLCARWHQLSIFYPFARNAHSPHVGNIDNSQEPYAFTGIYSQSIKHSINIRYSLLKHLLTLFFSKKNPSTPLGTGTIVKPLVFGFFDDPTLPPYGDAVYDHQFLYGDSIMAAPVLVPNVTKHLVYFPDCRWFDLRTLNEIQTRGESSLISAKFDEAVPYFLKGGSILLTQDTTEVSNSDDLTDIFTVTIGLDDFKKGQIAEAQGEILGLISYNEDYVYEKCAEKDCILTIKATYQVGDQTKLSIKVNNRNSNANTDPVRVNEIYILGALKDSDTHLKQVNLQSHDDQKIEMTTSSGESIKLTFSPLDFGNGVEYTFIFNHA